LRNTFSTVTIKIKWLLKTSLLLQPLLLIPSSLISFVLPKILSSVYVLFDHQIAIYLPFYAFSWSNFVISLRSSVCDLNCTISIYYAVLIVIYAWMNFKAIRFWCWWIVMLRITIVFLCCDFWSLRNFFDSDMNSILFQNFVTDDCSVILPLYFLFVYFLCLCLKNR